MFYFTRIEKLYAPAQCITKGTILSVPREPSQWTQAGFSMADEFEKAKDLFRWNQRFFAFVGVWPLESTYVRFTIWAVYYFTHIVMENADLYCVFGDLELMIENLSESTLQMLIFIKLVVMRFSKTIVTLINRVTDGIDPKFFDSPEEWAIYLNYNRIAKTFFKLWVTMGITTAFGYYLKPLQLRIEGALRNETVPYVLAYRIRLFFDVNDSTTFYLVWIYQAPILYMSIWHTASIGLLFSLVLHVCGQLSVLSHRIRNLDLGTRETHDSFKIIFRDIVERHRNILELARDINAVFGLILLEELLFSTVLLGLTCYSALVNVDSEDTSQFFSFLLYGATMLLLIYGYCAAGEYLVTESTNLYTAYYQCSWYETPDSFKKQLIICMIGASKPIHLTAGGFYIFSLVSFMSIVKTAGGYISMLRTMI